MKIFHLFWYVMTVKVALKGKHQESERKCRKKRLEDLGFEKIVKEGLGRYEKKQQSLVSQKPREESFKKERMVHSVMCWS